MRARFLASLEYLRGSYWFVPTLMALGAIILSFLATTLDSRLGPDWIEAVPWLYANKPAGARALLSTVAGSMITVAGVTFSITISAVVYATSTLGPRLLDNFMQDRGNQITLGTFIATFLYCLLVLRTVRNADESGGTSPFVPHVAILLALVLALASLGVLIYFFHHTPASMHVSNVTAKIGRLLQERIDTLFPERIGEAKPAAAPDLPEGFFEDAVRVRATRDGYLQALDDETLLDVATDDDLLLRVEYRPGDFVMSGQSLVLAWPPDRVEEETCDRIRSAFATGQRRTAQQDMLFLVNELVEVAARALSPGVNDPFTAIGCIDWLGAALVRLSERALPDPARQDDDGALRVVAMPVTFEVVAAAICDQLRPYVRMDRNAALHMMKMLAEAISAAPEGYRSILLGHARALYDDCQGDAATTAHDVADLKARLQVAERLAQPGIDGEVVADRHRWLGGRA